MSNPITDYWNKHYADRHCTLCGNSGVIDTTGVQTAAGVLVGRKNFCLCPNGQALRKAMGRNVLGAGKAERGYYNMDFTGFFIFLLVVGVVIGLITGPILDWLWDVLKPLIHEATR